MRIYSFIFLLCSFSAIGQGFTFETDCSTDFYTNNEEKVIQKWSLIDGQVVGGDTLLIGGGASLGYCGSSPTFYSGRYPEEGIQYYNPDSGWDTIAIPNVVINNGGYKEDQYFLGIENDLLRFIHYFDGTDLFTIDSFNEDVIGVADIAVDTLGRAWVVKVKPNSLRSLEVYDPSGFVQSYSFDLTGFGIYGSFFLNETLYLGMSEFSVLPNSIVPVILNGDMATLGTPIPFPNNNFYDMASCQDNSIISSLANEQAQSQVDIYPNPTNGIIYLPFDIEFQSVAIYGFNGQLVKYSMQKNIVDLSGLPNGMYVLKIVSTKGLIVETIVKQ